MREFDLLTHVRLGNARLGEHVLVPPGDDLAVVRLQTGIVLLGVDQVVAGRHFDLDAVPIELVGRKAITRSLSDVAAMAARPTCALAAVTLPPEFGEPSATQLFDAMQAAAEQYRCPLVGGDIAIHGSPERPLICSVTVLAEPGPTPPVTRAGARPGDIVYVTGALGGSLQPGGLGRHLTFEPRIDVALSLAATLGDRLHAMIDVSDGLGRDAAHIAAASSVQFRLRGESIPCTGNLDWRRAVGDGEDYELCFTASGDVPDSVEGVPVTAVGEVAAPAGGDVRRVVVLADGEEWIADELGWQHES